VNSHQEGSQVKRALARAGIGAIEISRESVLESRECGELMRVIAAIADPADAGLVKSALATTMAGSDAAALATLAQGDAAFARIVDALAEARRDWSDGGPQAALRRWLLAMGAGPRLAGLRDGERRLTNLAHLLELLGAHPEPREGAAAALRWLARMRADPAALGRDAGELRLESDEDLVRIVTVHKSKGLEFPVVFVAGLEEGLLPISLSLESREQVEEERRLMYVGMTRARQQLYISCARSRYHQGEVMFSVRSRFIEEIDPLHLTFRGGAAGSAGTGGQQSAPARPRTATRTPAWRAPAKPAAFDAGASDPMPRYEDESQETVSLRVGLAVTHETFGPGRIVALDGRGSEARAVVDFKSVGRKQLLLKFANLRTGA